MTKALLAVKKATSRSRVVIPSEVSGVLIVGLVSAFLALSKALAISAVNRLLARSKSPVVSPLTLIINFVPSAVGVTLITLPNKLDSTGESVTNIPLITRLTLGSAAEEYIVPLGSSTMALLLAKASKSSYEDILLT